MTRKPYIAIALFVAAALLQACGGGTSGDQPDAAPGAADAGATIDAIPGVGCSALEPRATPLEVFVGPSAWESKIIGQFTSAQSELMVMMYILTDTAYVDALIAAKNRGVNVRVLLDPNHPANSSSRNTLMSAGVSVKNAPSQFTNAHTKAVIVDGTTAVIMSGNMNYDVGTKERNYGVINRDPEDVADVIAIFESDWAASGFPDLSCTRLLVSPVNSRARMLEHINGATNSLDLSVMYLADSSIRAALIDAHERGTTVRVLLADPAEFTDNYDTIELLIGQNIPVKKMTAYFLHAKLVIADGVPFIGSENLSTTSLTQNREIGVLVTDTTAAAVAINQFAADWAAGSAP